MSNLRQSAMRPGLAAPIAMSFGLLLLSGCGSEPKPEVTSGVANPPAAVLAPDDPTARMARAVGDGKPGAAVNIKYDLSAKPEVGVPLEVKVVFIPTAGVDSLEATFNGMDGISLSGTLNTTFGAVKTGELYQHVFTVLPERVGMFYVTINASTRFGGTSMSRTFAIPFAVGDQAAQPKPPAPQKDASGKPVQPMQAEEPR